MTSKERIEKLLHLLETDPADSFSRYGLALAYNSMGEKQKAVAELRELLNHDENYLPAYHQLGRILGELNETTEAKRVYRKGVDLASSLKDEHERHEMEEELEDLEDEW
jgi:Tfp pilus assembly protein PilF